MTINLDIYCVTNKKLDFLEKTPLKLVGVGNENFSNDYIKCDIKKNIYHKEKYYSELTFHYWYWKNILPNEKKKWVGFCQKRRFWLQSKKKISSFKQLQKYILKKPPKKWSDYESIICKPIKIDNPKKMKLLKSYYID